MLLRLLGKLVMSVFFSTDWSFRVSFKNSCNDKIAITEVDKIRMQAGREGAHSKSFPKNKILRALDNTPINIILKNTPIANCDVTWCNLCYQKLLFLLFFKKVCINQTQNLETFWCFTIFFFTRNETMCDCYL